MVEVDRIHGDVCSDFGGQDMFAAVDCHCSASHNRKYFCTIADVSNKIIHTVVRACEFQCVGFRSVIQNPGTGFFD